MCIVSKPHIPDPAKDPNNPASKPLPILRNPILDGLLGNVAAMRAGTSAFRIDLLNPLMIPGKGTNYGGGSSSGGSSGGSSGSGGGGGDSSGSSSSGGSGGSGARASTGVPLSRY